MMRKVKRRATIILFCLFLGYNWQAVSLAKNDAVGKKPLYIFADKQRPTPSFDHTLHDEAFDDGGCAKCHHVMNTKTGKLAYVEEEAAACIECHAEKAVARIRGIREASHESCTGCHRLMIKAQKKTGPTTCGQCHRN